MWEGLPRSMSDEGGEFSSLPLLASNLRAWSGGKAFHLDLALTRTVFYRSGKRKAVWSVDGHRGL